MNGLAHIVLPVANWAGNIITWPIRAVGNTVDGIRNLSKLKDENEELRVRLDEALANKHACDVAIKENQKLAQELDMANSQPSGAIVADVILDNSALGHSTFIINRGLNKGIEKSMVVVSMDKRLVGIVIDVADNFSRVRGLMDSDSNIAVRIVGSEVYGFLSGKGSGYPVLKFLSDPEFQITRGITLVTSGISGVVPSGLIIGDIIEDTDVDVLRPDKLSRVMVLKFDSENKYK